MRHGPSIGGRTLDVMRPVRRASVPTLALLLAASGCAASPGATRIGFEDETTGAPSAVFESSLTGPGREGVWRVQEDATAAAGRKYLRQTDGDDTEKRFVAAVLRGAPLADVRVRVRCRPVDGRVDRGCGVIARWQDAGDYYVTRANALEGNVRLYHFVGGVRTQISSWTGTIAAGAWHDLTLEVRGDRLRVEWDGQTVIEATDATIAGPGRTGLWTKADSISDFDELEVTPL